MSGLFTALVKDKKCIT